MRLAPLRLGLLGCVLALSACGGGEQQEATAPLTQAPSGPVATSGAVTDGRLGPATTAGGDGEQVLSAGGPARVDAGSPARGAREGVDGAADCGAAEADPTAESLPAVAATTLCLLNVERTSRGLAPLGANARLAEAALAQSEDMVARKYFAHESPGGSTPVQRIRAAGYIPADRGWTVGENLAWGTGALATPAAIMRAWMASPGHRENILKPAYREIGLGIVLGAPKAGVDGGATYATTFGGIEGGAVASRPVSDPPAASVPAAAAQAAPATSAKAQPSKAAAARAKATAKAKAKAKVKAAAKAKAKRKVKRIRAQARAAAARRARAARG